MGFRLNRTYVLRFQGAMEGAEVKIRSTPVAVVMEMMEPVPHARLVELLVEYVQEWNFEDADGNPLPVETQAISRELEEPVLAAVLREWMRAARGVTAPLDVPSTSGEQSPAVELPMETL